MDYPNLELIEHKFKECLVNSDIYWEKNNKVRSSMKTVHMDIVVEVFPQLWGSTNIGFDISQEGDVSIGGSAMTEEYTVVVRERLTNIYAVFFGNNPCYLVYDPTEKFYEDLANKNMESYRIAKSKY